MGPVAQQVVVSTVPPQLETVNGSGGTLIDARTLQSVPLNGGQSFTLIGTGNNQFTLNGTNMGYGNIVILQPTQAQA